MGIMGIFLSMRASGLAFIGVRGLGFRVWGLELRV